MQAPASSDIGHPVPGTLSGGCLCGAVRYEIDLAGERASTCHCSMCRRQSGGAFMAFITVPRARFRLLSGTIAGYRSSPFGLRGFCGSCGTPLTMAYDFEPEAIGIVTGSLDDPDAVPPDRHWGAESMLSWLKIDDGLPRLSSEEDPDVLRARQHRPPEAE